MLVLIVEITSPSGDYHKSLPISEQAASDPARRGNMIKSAVLSYVDGRATSWKVVDGDRIVAQSSMKTALTSSVPGVADSKAEIAEQTRLTQGDANYVSALTGAPLQTVERDYHDDNEREAAPDPFDIPKALSLADVPIYEDPKSKANTQKIADGLEERRVSREAAFNLGVMHATKALQTNSVVQDFKTPFGDGGNGQDTNLRDAYEEGYNSVVNNCLTDEQRNRIGGVETIHGAENRAEILSAEFEKPVWAVDRGSGVRPRYAVIEGYKVGDYVSKGFNGDYYPVGRIIGLGGQGSPTIGWRIIAVETPEGREIKFWRRKQSDVWKEGSAGGTFGLVRGLCDRRNPSF